MFAYLNGKLELVTPSSVIMDIGGLGYELLISLNTYEKIKDKQQAKLFTHLQIREDAWVLYGFAEEEERTTFRLLLGISGVGSATARMILSSLTTQELSNIVIHQDAKQLEKVKGIGAKTAQRILLELKGKMELFEENNNQISWQQHNRNKEDALIALISLGINKPIAEQVLSKLSLDDQEPVENWIKAALQKL